MMEYTVQQLGQLSGVTSRTLRYYHQIGLLRPARVGENGYRYYGRGEVARLQQILFYRELGLPLEEIGALLDQPDFDKGKALEAHLEALTARRDRLDQVIDTVKKTILDEKGDVSMTDPQRFEGLRQRMLEENEAAYGQELRETYGEKVIEASQEKWTGMSQSDWARGEALGQEINEALIAAMAQGDPAGEEAHRLCRLHREWLTLFWPQGTYTKALHRGMGELYVADERFRNFYDTAAGPGGAEFLHQALEVYCRA